ncbi:MAG: hypothetical protein GX958_04815, partial [Desulfitobacterium sp.]|nr:hypothetical protein [Desulfitobacterium sp.]
LSAASNPNSLESSLVSLSSSEAITPEERNEMETLVLNFTEKYYTYSLETYIADGEKLLPLLTHDYQADYLDSLTKSYNAAQVSNANSTVTNAMIIYCEKVTPDQGIAKVQFQANVLTHQVETVNRYNITLELKKEENQWRIQNIVDEDPVAFSNLEKLL